MTASHALQPLRRPSVLVFLALAIAVGAGAWLLAHELTSEVRPLSTASVAPAPPAVEVAREAIDTAIDVAMPTAAAAGSGDPAGGALPAPVEATAAAAAPPAEDPYAAAIIEPVDPAEALFGDQPAVAVSN
jgi:hypothetical protein